MDSTLIPIYFEWFKTKMGEEEEEEVGVWAGDSLSSFSQCGNSGLPIGPNN